MRYPVFFPLIVLPLPAANASLAASLISSVDLSITSITIAFATPALPPLTDEMDVCTANRNADPVDRDNSERASAFMSVHIS